LTARQVGFRNEGVEGHIGDATSLDFLEDASVDFVFASNVFEHMPQASFAHVLSTLRRKLRTGGTLNILQPNYRFCCDEYVDD
jgi:predicted SAM-dependent methyltransferase